MCKVCVCTELLSPVISERFHYSKLPKLTIVHVPAPIGGDAFPFKWPNQLSVRLLPFSFYVDSFGSDRLSAFDHATFFYFCIKKKVVFSYLFLLWQLWWMVLSKDIDCTVQVRNICSISSTHTHTHTRALCIHISNAWFTPGFMQY